MSKQINGTEMNNHDTGNTYLTMLCGFCALISLSEIQPYLTFAASIIAIVSGAISIIKKLRK